MMSSQHHPGWFPIPPQKNDKKCAVKISWLKRNPSPRSRRGGEESQHFAGCLIRKSHMFFGEIIICLFYAWYLKMKYTRKGQGFYYSSQFDINHWAYFFQNTRFCWCPPNLAGISACGILHANLQTNQALPNSRRLVLISHINVTFQFHFRIWLRYSCYRLSSATASHSRPP